MLYFKMNNFFYIRTCFNNIYVLKYGSYNDDSIYPFLVLEYANMKVYTYLLIN